VQAQSKLKSAWFQCFKMVDDKHLSNKGFNSTCVAWSLHLGAHPQHQILRWLLVARPRLETPQLQAKESIVAITRRAAMRAPRAGAVLR
jgi:hypothetical protein